MHGMCTRNYCECVNDKLQYTTSVCMVNIVPIQQAVLFCFYQILQPCLTNFVARCGKFFEYCVLKGFMTFWIIKCIKNICNSVCRMFNNHYSQLISGIFLLRCSKVVLIVLVSQSKKTDKFCDQKIHKLKLQPESKHNH